MTAINPTRKAVPPNMLSAFDDLHEAILKAKALSYMTYGEAGEHFRTMNDSAQDEYLWALSGLIVDAAKACERMVSEDRKGGAA